jgi:Cof subfamily protein (haloacid dehalogenase superfamily)
MIEEDFMIQLAAIDLDGTLLHDDMTLGEYSISVIQKALKKGIKIVIATGRGWHSASAAAKALGLKGLPVICYSGAWIMDSDSGKALKKTTIPLPTAAKILDRAKKEKWTIFYSIDDAIYAPTELASSEDFKKYGNRKVIDAGENFYHPESSPIRLILAEKDEKKRESIKSALNRDFGQSISVVYPGDIFLDVREKSVNKADALRFIAGKLHISLQNAAAFGNTENDISMLKAVRYSYAVANAEEDVKKAAAAVCPSNNEDGVAIALEQLMKE